MNFEQLIYVKSVYEQESMIRASELMHISQSAMSQSIANLETELDIHYFIAPERDNTDRNWQTIDSKNIGNFGSERTSHARSRTFTNTYNRKINHSHYTNVISQTTS